MSSDSHLKKIDFNKLKNLNEKQLDKIRSSLEIRRGLGLTKKQKIEEILQFKPPQDYDHFLFKITLKYGNGDPVKAEKMILECSKELMKKYNLTFSELINIVYSSYKEEF